MALATQQIDLSQQRELRAKHDSLRTAGLKYQRRFDLFKEHTCAVCGRKFKTGDRVLTDKETTQFMHWSPNTCSKVGMQPFSSRSTPMDQAAYIAGITGGMKKVDRVLSPPPQHGPTGTYKTKPAPKPAVPARLRLRRQALSKMVRPVAMAA